MTENNANLLNAPRRSPLRAALRVVIAVLLQVVMFCLVSGVAGNDFDFQTGLNGFLFALLPSVSILLLIPVIIRGTPGEKIIAVVLLLPAAWFAFTAWAAVIGGLSG
jgi:hypothetical protein